MSARETPSTVLITGGTDGFGRAAALLLAEQGYRVFAAGRSAERRAQLAALARERRLPLETIEMDVCDDASVERAMGEIHASRSFGTGPIDVLVNSAGVGYFAVMEDIRLEDLRRQFETNFFGVVRVIQKVLPGMRARGRGRIINLSSAAGKVALPTFGPYSSSKFALEAMSDALRLELHAFGIHVVVIEPGYIPTGFQDASTELSTDYKANSASSPYARVYEGYRKARGRHMGGSRYTPEDCARVILRAVRETPPKPRYTVTRAAKVANLAKRLLPDRMLDRLLIRTFGLKSGGK
jgi:NAD(P)-dependent dehydrogenase (short-subunit alcohol dehydrogenase family)